MAAVVGGVLLSCGVSAAAGERWVEVPYSGIGDWSDRDAMSPDGTMVALGGGRFWSLYDGLLVSPNANDDQLFAVGIIGFADDRAVIGSEGSGDLSQWVWTRGVGFQPVKDVFAGLADETWAGITGIAGDGRSIVGVRVTGGNDYGPDGPAMRWEDDGTEVVLGIPDGFTGCDAFAASHDGGVISGLSMLAAGEEFALRGFVWTDTSGLENVSLPTGYRLSEFWTVSSDGSTIGGDITPDGPYLQIPMIWRRDSGFRILGFPGPEYGPFDRGFVVALSADGSLAFGYVTAEFVNNNDLNFIWTEATGVVGAVEYVDARIEHPANPGFQSWHWHVFSVHDISDDGRTFLISAGWKDGDGDWHGGGAYLLTLNGDTCPRDVTGDGRIDVADFNVLARNFGDEVEPGTLGDLNGSGVVTASDFNVLVNDFGCGG